MAGLARSERVYPHLGAEFPLKLFDGPLRIGIHGLLGALLGARSSRRLRYDALVRASFLSQESRGELVHGRPRGILLREGPVSALRVSEGGRHLRWWYGLCRFALLPVLALS